MVRLLVEQTFSSGKKYIEAACLSTDTKPVDNLITGSFCMEVDTGKTYLFNEEAESGSEWVDQDFNNGGD